MFDTLLIANRGEIACRIIRTARRMGIRCIAVFSAADANALHVQMADAAFPIGPAPAAESYLRADRIVAAAIAAGAQAVHPGYGFLSENAAFADACAAAGLVFVGPPAAAIRAMGSKAESKALMVAAGVPVVPGYHGEDQAPARLAEEAARIGFPILIKASAGGGGKGMRPVASPAEFLEQLAGAQREALAFGDTRVLLERYLQSPRHVEVQVFADDHGNTIHLHTRDCSAQRRHQKVLEEAPAPDLPPELRTRLHEAAVAAARAVGYRNAGTVEFIVEGSDAFFMEMNTRLQVEHPVTELVTGLDLVEWQLRVAAGEPLPLPAAPPTKGHAVEVRLYAEDPALDFRPAVGPLHRFAMPAAAPDLRIESGVRQGDAVTPFYDPMIAKLVAWGADRPAALARLGQALGECLVMGLATNLDFLARLVALPAMRAAELDTGLIPRFAAELLPTPQPPPLAALAAALLPRLLLPVPPVEANDPHSPWDQRSGWRLQGAGVALFALDSADSAHILEVTAAPAGWLLRTGDSTAAIDGHQFGPDTWQITLDGRQQQALVLTVGDAIQVRLTGPDGGTWSFLRTDPYAPPSTSVARESRLTAPIPGRIVQLLVGIGDAVGRGQLLAVLEAMKTELRIVAPADGVVESLGCAAGDQVEEGTAIVVLAPPP